MKEQYLPFVILVSKPPFSSFSPEREKNNSRQTDLFVAMETFEKLWNPYAHMPNLGLWSHLAHIWTHCIRKPLRRILYGGEMWIESCRTTDVLFLKKYPLKTWCWHGPLSQNSKFVCPLKLSERMINSWNMSRFGPLVCAVRHFSVHGI